MSKVKYVRNVIDYSAHAEYISTLEDDVILDLVLNHLQVLRAVDKTAAELLDSILSLKKIDLDLSHVVCTTYESIVYQTVIQTLLKKGLLQFVEVDGICRWVFSDVFEELLHDNVQINFVDEEQ